MSGPRPLSATVVLIAEDNGFVRMMAADMLEDAGFTVIDTSTADEAWAILEERSDIGVLFTDIDMPGSIDGFVLAKRVARRWPHIRLVITSGRCRPAPDDMPDHGKFVSKPYLVAQVLDAFDQTGSAS